MLDCLPTGREGGGTEPGGRDERDAQRNWSGSEPGWDIEQAIPGTVGRVEGGIDLTRHTGAIRPAIGQDWNYGDLPCIQPQHQPQRHQLQEQNCVNAQAIEGPMH